MAAKFIGEEGLLKGLVLPLEGGEEWVIGRDPALCQLLIDDPSVSQRHLLCRSTSEGIVIENLSEAASLKVNGQEIDGSYLLRKNDLVAIGQGVFRFNGEEQVLEELEEQLMPQTDLQTAINHEEKSSESITTATAPEQLADLDLDADIDADADIDKEGDDSLFDETVFAHDDDELLTHIDFNLLESSRWLLKVIAGPNNGAEFSMQPEASYAIGTDPSTCDIVFHDSSVSRQHARLTLKEDGSLLLEDLKSRNGTFVDGERIGDSFPLACNGVVTMGTTSFVVLDREGKRETIISPLLPSIVKVLQREEEKKEELAAALEASKERKEGELNNFPQQIAALTAKEEAKEPVARQSHFGKIIFMAMLTGILVVAGIGTMTLFQGHEVVVAQVNIKEQIDDALASFPSIKYSFNKTTGRLFIMGHVLTAIDRTQLLYNLQGLTFIKSIDPNIIIDEYVWQEGNQLLSKNQEWRGIAIQATSPGHFVLTGYLKSRKQADLLSDYLTQNFHYLDLLENRVVVEEDILTRASILMQEKGFHEVSVQMNNGEIKLSGAISIERSVDLDKAIEQIKSIPGVRQVSNFVVEVAPENSVIDMTSRYKVTGYSGSGDVNLNVVINGKILSRGDVIDGMTITSIKPTSIFLEKEGIKYRIDYNK